MNPTQSHIGAVFTPLAWAVWVIEKYGLGKEWLQGASFFDPTAGEGAFLEAFVAWAIQNGHEIANLPLHELYGNEKETRFIENFHQRMKRLYGISIPAENFTNSDIFFTESTIQADYLIGNPPWLTFADLPQDYKPLIKPLFVQHGLVPNLKEVFLGNSRIDIATLVVAKSLQAHLKKGGKAFFYLPLSIFLNDGANRYFRNYELGGMQYAVNEIYDFQDNSIFEGVATRYGLVQIERDVKQVFPIPYFIKNEDEWDALQAAPLFANHNPLTIFKEEEELQQLNLFQKIPLPRNAQPRQGVNTCGANHVFIFDTLKKLENGKVLVGNAYQSEIELPEHLLFPMVTRKNFTEKKLKPHKWILLPYDTETARPLEWSEIEQETLLTDYLSLHKNLLQHRKGRMIQAGIKRGYWWTLLGIGAYSFRNYKILWEAFGKKNFHPILLDGDWQGNQALHAFVPLNTLEQAESTLVALQHPSIETYLASNRMQGTCNWAQPGKMKNLLDLG